MKNQLIKDTFREIKNTFSRFISIFAIIAIGVGFFAGVKAGGPDMKITAHDYYSDKNLMDMRLVSTMGFTDGDIEAIKNTKGVRDTQAAYFLDVSVERGQSTNIVRLLSYSEDSPINKPWLMEGRLPENSGEILVEEWFLQDESFEIGDDISFKSGTEDPLSDFLDTDVYTIVGTMNSPQYISADRGNTNIGNGHIDFYAMVPKDNFVLDYYTEVYVTSNEGAFSYSPEYNHAIEELELMLENTAKSQEDLRYKEILDEANEELDEAKEEIVQGKEELEKAKLDLADGKKELHDSKKKTESDFKKNQNAIHEGWQLITQNEEKFHGAINTAQGQIDNGFKELAQGKIAYEEGVKDLEASRKELETLKETLETSKELLPEEEHTALEAQYQQGLIALEEGEAILNVTKEELESSEEQLENSQRDLDTQVKQTADKLNGERSKLREGQNNLNEAKAAFNEEIRKAEAEIRDGEIEIQDAEAEILDAEAEIAEAEEEIADIDKPEWVLLNRDNNPGYTEFGENADRIDAIASVFPVFFLLVALLVSLTTMTRMVEEERTHIGTLKALGYSNMAIVSKYFIYANLASVTGSLLGLIVGFRLFPWVIFNAYGMMYTFPDVITPFHTNFAILSILAALMCTSVAVLLACYKEFGTQPAQLMRPKAPKAGKRVLIEKISFIWNNMGFTAKVTARNLFRYKKRMLMTIIGISGCTALMLTGFGIKDSISDLSNKQFGEISVYDLLAILDKDEDNGQLIDYIDTHDNIDNFKEIYYETVHTAEGDSHQASIYVPSGTEELDKFINLQNFDTKESISLDDDGVIISYKLSELLEKNIGDTIRIENSDGKEVSLDIGAITENYLGHSIYMTENYYLDKFQEELDYNAVLALMADSAQGPEEELSESLYEFDSVIGINFMRRNVAAFDDMIVSLDLVVIVLIISASLLAFIVLYNLTNINVNERIREIATIKVLGFYDREVSAYIYRENIVLTIMGTIVGFGLGSILHRFVISTAELNDLMFGRNIFPLSYAIAGVLTIVFALLVNIAVHFRLKKVDMIESLKSIE